MNSTVSNIVLRGFSKSNRIENGWNFRGFCVYVALFRSKLSQGMRNQLCDVLG